MAWILGKQLEERRHDHKPRIEAAGWSNKTRGSCEKLKIKGDAPPLTLVLTRFPQPPFACDFVFLCLSLRPSCTVVAIPCLFGVHQAPLALTQNQTDDGLDAPSEL